MEEYQKEELKKAGKKLDLKVSFVWIKGNSIFTRLWYRLEGLFR